MCKEGKNESEEYYATIDRCAENEENFIIQNSAPTHASYLIKTFFKHAKSNVDIFTGKLYPNVFDDADLIKEAVAFLNSNDKKLRIAYQDAEIAPEEILSRKFIKAILAESQKKGTLEIYCAKDVDPKINHFAVMDRTAFRFELEHSMTSPKAQANFGDKKSAEILARVFDSVVLANSAPIPTTTH